MGLCDLCRGKEILTGGAGVGGGWTAGAETLGEGNGVLVELQEGLL